MAYRCIHHDLIAVPLGHREPGIYWLRLYKAADGRHVAIVTEVPGNPSFSVTNAMSRMAYYIAERFQIDATRLVLYEVWPGGSVGHDVAGFKRVSAATEAPSWNDASRDEVEALVGQALPSLPGHDELYKRVLALGGGLRREIWRQVFFAIPVKDLPPPHNPSNCTHSDRFRRIAQGKTATSPVCHSGVGQGTTLMETPRAGEGKANS